MDSSLRRPPARLPWPPAVRAILWLDAVLLVVAGLALAGKPPMLVQDTSLWTWLALAGSTLTAVLAALAAFHLCVPQHNPAWTMLPVPAVFLWAATSGLGYLATPAGGDVWGDTLAEVWDCLGFLLNAGVPLLALILLMLRRTAPAVPQAALMMGALASAGAAASLLTLIHPHAGAGLDLCGHAAALAVMLGIGALTARLTRS